MLNLPVVSFFVEPALVSEGNPFSFIFTLSEPVPAGGLVLNLTVEDSDNEGPDGEFLFDQSTNVTGIRFILENGLATGATVTLVEGATEARLVSVPFVDGVREGEETSTFTIIDGQGYKVNPENNSATFTIIDEPIDKLLAGTPGDNSLYGTGAAETIFGFAGNDAIYGNGGEDTLFGASGNDNIFGSSSSELIDGGSGDDTIYGNGGMDTIYGGDGDDLIYSGNQADTILAGTGNDIIYANGGGDFIDTGAGFDTVWLGAGGVTVLETGDGYDTIKNFQLGVTQFQVGNLENLSFTDSFDGVQIFQGNDLLAVITWQLASVFNSNASEIFAS